MSRFFSKAHSALAPYVPGEQPQDKKYIKLNTNESPYPPSPGVAKAVEQESHRLNLYSDPECRALREALATLLGVGPDMLLLSNGSDELLYLAFLAFGDADHPFVFPNITYGFYPVFCQLAHIPYRELPLRPDFTLDLADYLAPGRNIVLANPNAPTGIALSPGQIEPLLQNHPDSVVIVDEAYVDFGAESCIPLTKRYDNLLVVRTFSKSRSMAGARLGFGIGHPALIADLNTIKYSINPYNVNRLTLAAGLAAVAEDSYYRKCCEAIAQTRDATAKALSEMGFTVLPSKANFVFARHPAIAGEALYAQLRQRGVLIRHLSRPEIAAFNRITIGAPEQMDVFLRLTKEILQGREPL